MTNSTYAAKIARAVNNDEWQEYRVLMKGQSTQDKISDLIDYYNDHHDGMCAGVTDCDYCIRVDNYIKALCRGGQLYSGQSITNLINRTLQIKK